MTNIITGYEVPRIDRQHFLALKSALRMSQSESEQRKLFIFGLGYVGTSFARYMKNKGWSVCGTCTNVNKAIELRNEGIKTFLFDEVTLSRGQTDVSEDILSSDCVLSTIPPILPNRDLVLEAHSDDLRQAVFKRNLKWIGYLSSTGVYGDCGGAWVKEDRPLKPENEKTRARADVENYWSQLHLRGGLPVHIFRLAGIYGPGRSALDTLLKFPDESLKIPADDTTFVSRIHVDDIMQVLGASMSNPSKGEVYNVADDLPSTRYDVLSYICRLFKLPDIELSTAIDATSRGGSKRVDNTKMRDLLLRSSLSLVHPDYRSGLASLAPSYQKQFEEKFLKPKSPIGEVAAGVKGEETSTLKTQDEIVSLQGRIKDLEGTVKLLEKNQLVILNALNQINDAIKSL
eukprot:gene2190-2331_t